MQRRLASAAGLALLALVAVPARSVTITNVTTSTVEFRDNFENGSFTPSVGFWDLVGPDVTVQNSTVPPLPGPAEGSFYAELFRDSDTRDQGNLQAVLAAPQTTVGDLIRLSMMVFIPADDTSAARAQLILDDGDVTTARAWVVPDGNGNVMAVGPAPTFTYADTGLDYTPGVWQEWDLEYAVGATTFSVTVNGVAASGFTSPTSGGVDKADLFNGVSDPAGVFYLDAVPSAETTTPEPDTCVLAGLALAALAARRSRR